jgi:hypothetical protein
MLISREGEIEAMRKNIVTSFITMGVAVVVVAAFSMPASAQAQNATWLSAPSSNFLDQPNNWSTNSVPTGTATFGTSNTTSLTFGKAGITDAYGGWTFNWPAWSPAAELDWRGFLTVDALRALRANGRL